MFDRYIAFRARQAPDAVAIDMPSGKLSFATLNVAVDRIAAALAAERGRPALVAVRIADPYLHWLVLLGLARLGLASASVPPGHEAKMLPRLRPDLVVSDQPNLPDAERLQTRWLHASASWSADALANPAAPPARRAAFSAATGRVVTSSGTTGTPKRIALSWQVIERRIEEAVLWTADIGGLARVLSILGAGGGSFLPSLATWAAGGSVLFATPEPSAVAASLARLRPTLLVASPIQLKAILDALPDNAPLVPDLQIALAGSHTPLAVRRAAEQRLTPRIIIAYGSSEASLVATGRTELLGDDEAACGWIVPGINAEVVDEDGTPLPYGTVGLLRFRGSGVIQAYQDDADPAGVEFRAGWYHSGDVGTLAPDGALRVLGRADERMNFGGVKILPGLMETAARSCPGVVDAAAFARPGADGLDEPWLAIVRGEDFDPAALDAAVREHLLDLPPIRVAWISSIPRNAGGKVERDRLRAAAEALG